MSHPIKHTLNLKSGTVKVTLRKTKPAPRRGRTDIERNTPEWHEYLRELAQKHVKPIEKGGHWKGPCYALVDPSIADDVSEAMDFIGALVLDEQEKDGKALLLSNGYWANGF